MFIDEAIIHIRSGDGGAGMISFRREKYVPFGGPNGGDGGDGGDVIFVVDTNVSGLGYFRRNSRLRAGDGTKGTVQNMTGKRGESLYVRVPPGTLVRSAENGDLLADLTEKGQEATLLAGGRGGRGNARFASSANRAPRIAERGEPGTELRVSLELKLIADVGLAGKPNAGKSTLLASVSAAQPKIASYPFTTLIPNLGVVEFDDFETIIIADIPGLIEGAADGIGLGHDFLRHIERTRVLIHLLDGAAFEPLEDWRQINRELTLYNVKLEQKPQLVVLNKMDLPDAVAWEPLLREEVEKEGYEFMSISAVTGQGVREMLYRVRRMVEEAPDTDLTSEEEIVVIRPKEIDDTFTIEKLADDEWRVHGTKIERIASMTYFEFDYTAMRFQRQLDSSGISDALREAGVQDGDIVYIGDQELEWQDETM